MITKDPNKMNYLEQNWASTAILPTLVTLGGGGRGAGPHGIRAKPTIIFTFSFSVLNRASLVL